MVFNSLTFLVFFTIVFLIYWFPLKNTTRGQNIFLLLASYFFYGYANWKMLPLLIAATIIFYYLGKGIASAKSEKLSYRLTFMGVVLGVGTLLYFKYFNFFIESFAAIFEACGLHTNLHTFNIIMPLGISFFTFRLLSYVIDIYRGKCKPTNDIIAFGTYIAFFPCLLSGPIDRPTFINQLKAVRTFEYEKAVDGCRQILWGMFKKVVVADNCATYVDQVWGNIDGSSGSTLVLAAILYSFQMYADFSGYSDMAIGGGKLLGFKITDNFRTPFFALNVADFWRRWHITLGSWIRNYIYIQLGGNRKGFARKMLNLFIAMTICGFWHGAGMQFILWGMVHGALLVINNCFQKTNIVLPSLLCRFLTFISVMALWILFRAASISDAVSIFRSLFDFHNFWIVNSISPFTKIGLFKKLITVNDSYVRSFSLLKALAMIFPLLFIVHFAPNAQKIVSEHFKINRFWLFLSIIMMITALFALFIQKNQAEFLYFQFFRFRFGIFAFVAGIMEISARILYGRRICMVDAAERLYRKPLR